MTTAAFSYSVTKYALSYVEHITQTWKKGDKQEFRDDGEIWNGGIQFGVMKFSVYFHHAAI
jgi:hypothetical protein